MQNLFNKFIFWLEGLIQDDPIPFEINSLVFFINSHFEIGFSGTEKQNVQKIDHEMFFPLEAEFFYCPNLTKKFEEISEKVRLNMVKTSNHENKIIKTIKRKKLEVLRNLLIKLKKHQYFSKFNIFYGFLFEKAHKI